MKPHKFDEREQLFVWLYETDDGTHELFIDIDENIRFFIYIFILIVFKFNNILVKDLKLRMRSFVTRRRRHHRKRMI